MQPRPFISWQVRNGIAAREHINIRAIEESMRQLEAVRKSRRTKGRRAQANENTREVSHDQA